MKFRDILPLQIPNPMLNSFLTFGIKLPFVFGHYCYDLGFMYNQVDILPEPYPETSGAKPFRALRFEKSWQ